LKVFGVRHGESEWNLLGLCNDDPNRPGDLTARGRRQVMAAAERLIGQPVDRVYCSPLPRTRQSAALIAGRLGVALTVDDRLRDIRSGFDGQPVAEYLAAIAQDPVHAEPPGGESLAQHAARVHAFLDWLRRQPLRAVVLVAHEETLRAFKARAEGIALEALFGASFANGAVYSFDLQPS
jgi:broad specificity phosphatase PhoE